MNTTNICVAQQAMYAAAPSAQLRPEPDTPGAEALGYFATLRKASAGARHKSGVYSQQQYEYSIEVKERL